VITISAHKGQKFATKRATALLFMNAVMATLRHELGQLPKRSVVGLADIECLVTHCMTFQMSEMFDSSERKPNFEGKEEFAHRIRNSAIATQPPMAVRPLRSAI